MAKNKQLINEERSQIKHLLGDGRSIKVNEKCRIGRTYADDQKYKLKSPP